MKHSERHKATRGSQATRLLLSLLIVVLFVGGAAYTYTQLWSGNQDDGTQAQNDSDINFGPPTEEEQRSGDDAKDRIVEDRENQDSDSQDNGSTDDQKKDADVIIVDASQYDDIVEVRAFVNNHIQDGTCTYRFTRGENTIEESRPAYADASTTLCPTLQVDRSQFATVGDWSVAVSYTSDEAEGTSSETLTIE